MSYIEKTAFEARVSNNRRNDLVNVAGRFRAESEDDACSAGFLCVRDGQLPCAGFEGVLNENAWYMKAAAAPTASDVIYAANHYESNKITDPRNGNSYFVGHETLGLPIPKGEDGTFTNIVFDGQHIYRFGEGNIKGTLGENKYLTIKDGLLVPAASAPTDNGAVYFTVNGSGNFTVGTTQDFGYVDAIACTVWSA